MKHFTFEELEHSAIADALHIDNHANEKVRANLRRLVDEVLDSGVTLQRVSDFLRQRHDVLDVRTAVIVSKAIARPPEGLPQADWTGFSAPDGYLVGYGLDSHELYRNLPYIAVLK